jgi:hypothetical protein
MKPSYSHYGSSPWIDRLLVLSVLCGTGMLAYGFFRFAQLID